MFGSKIYDPDATWRAEPASAMQLRALADLGFRPIHLLTKGEAADEISARTEPAPEEVEFLRFFGVRLANGTTALDARRAIGLIIADEVNRRRWEQRPADSEQRELIRAVEGKVPKGLTWWEAQQRINTYSKDGALEARMEAAMEAWDRREERRAMIDDHCEMINLHPGSYGLKRVGKKLVEKAIEQWEAAPRVGVEVLEHRQDYYEQLADRIRRIDPSKASKDARDFPRLFVVGAQSNGPPLRSGGSSATSWAWIAVTLVALFMLLGNFSR